MYIFFAKLVNDPIDSNILLMKWLENQPQKLFSFTDKSYSMSIKLNGKGVLKQAKLNF